MCDRHRADLHQILAYAGVVDGGLQGVEMGAPPHPGAGASGPPSLCYGGSGDFPRGGGKKITACLVYPCRVDTWRSLQARGRLVHRATVGSGTRPVDVVLTAVPMGVSMAEAMLGVRV